MTEEDLTKFVEEVIKDMVEAGELEAGEEMEMDGEESEMEMDIDLEDDAAPMMEKKDEDKKKEEVKEEEINEEEVNEEKVEESNELETALAEVEELRKELNEVNLLNAKLLYTNKIFKSKNLTEDKKVKVLKAFDKASTVKEAKVIFETLNEGITAKKAKPSINEVKGSASKATGVAPVAKQPIVENDAFRRMQQLAGIIKNN